MIWQNFKQNKFKLNVARFSKLDKEIKDTEEEIASETVEIILEETKGLDSENGGFNTGHIWKLKKKIIPKAVNVPTAMRTSEWKLITCRKDINKSSIEYYKNVLWDWDIKGGLEEHRDKVEFLCKTRLDYTKKHS